MLRKTIYNLTMGRGIATGKDPKHITTELQQLENGVIDQRGVVKKRHGLSYNTTYTEPYLTKRNERPVLIGQASIRVFDGDAGASTGTFDQVDTSIRLCDVDHSPVGGLSQGDLDNLDMCEQETFVVYTYTNTVQLEDDAGTSATRHANEVLVVDKVTGATIDSHSFWVGIGRDTSRAQPARLTKCGTTTYIWFIDYDWVGGVYFLAYSTVNSAGVINHSTDLVHAGMTEPDPWIGFDACELDDANSTMMVVYGNMSDYVTVLTWDANGFVAHADTGITGPVSGYATVPAAVAVYKHDTGQGMVVGCFCGSGWSHRVWAMAYDTSCAVVGTAATVTTIYDDEPYKSYVMKGATGLRLGSNSSVAYATFDGPDDYAIYRWACTITAGAVVISSGSVLVPHARLASKLYGNAAEYYALALYRSNQNSADGSHSGTAGQGVYWVIDEAGRPVGKAFPGAAGPIDLDPSYYMPCRAVTDGNGITHTAALRWTSVRLAPTNNSACSSVAIERLAIEHSYPTSIQTTEINGRLHIPNSIPYVFDGQNLVEHGFLTYPEGVSGIQCNTATGALVDGLYGYCFLWEWSDGAGNVERSSPSYPISVTVAAPNDTVQLSVPALPAPDAGTASKYSTALGYVTRKSGVKLVVYRTDVNGGNYYRLASVPATQIDRDSVMAQISLYDHGCPGDMGVTLLWWDGVSAYTESGVGGSYSGTGSDLLATSGAEQIYTMGGVVENVQPPAYRSSCIHQGRLVLVDRQDESRRAVYSRYCEPDRAIGVNDVFEIALPEGGGAITAVASFRDRLLLFKENSIYMTYGNGLSDNGSGSDYAQPILLSAGVGCIDRKTLLELPSGLAFLSNIGMVMLRQDFTLDMDFGLPIKYYTDTDTLTAAAIIPESRYAIWTTNARGLVYCYSSGQWATFTNHSATDAIECNGILYFAQGNTRVCAQSNSVYTDNGSYISMKLVTGMIPLSEVEGYGRCYRIVAIGQNISGHMLYIQPRFDMDVTWDSADLVDFDSDAFGYQYDYSGYYDDAYPTTYHNRAYEVTARVRRTKAKCIQIKIYDGAKTGVDAGAGYSLAKVQLLLGIREPWLKKLSTREAS